MRAVYLISCSMNRLNGNYEPFWHTLQKEGAVQALESTWLLETDRPLAELNQLLVPLTYDTDRLLIVEIAPKAGWAATRLRGDTSLWLKQRRP
jgi:hypothetical protein